MNMDGYNIMKAVFKQFSLNEVFGSVKFRREFQM